MLEVVAVCWIDGLADVSLGLLDAEDEVLDDDRLPERKGIKCDKRDNIPATLKRRSAYSRGDRGLGRA